MFRTQRYVTPRTFPARTASLNRDQVRGLIHSEVSSTPKDHRDELAVVHSLCCTVWIDKSHSASACSSLFLWVGWNKEGKVWGCPRNVKLNQVSCRKAFRGEKDIYWNKKRRICQPVETIVKTQKGEMIICKKKIFILLYNKRQYLSESILPGPTLKFIRIVKLKKEKQNKPAMCQHITFCVPLFRASRTNITLLHPLLCKFETNQYQCSLLIEDRVMIISTFSRSPVRKPRAHLWCSRDFSF